MAVAAMSVAGLATGAGWLVVALGLAEGRSLALGRPAGVAQELLQLGDAGVALGDRLVALVALSGQRGHRSLQATHCTAQVGDHDCQVLAGLVSLRRRHERHRSLGSARLHACTLVVLRWPGDSCQDARVAVFVDS